MNYAYNENVFYEIIMYQRYFIGIFAFFLIVAYVCVALMVD